MLYVKNRFIHSSHKHGKMGKHQHHPSIFNTDSFLVTKSLNAMNVDRLWRAIRGFRPSRQSVPKATKPLFL